MGNISGFMVVRNPENAIAAFHAPNQRIGQTTYRGIDRLPWEDIALAYYNGNLPTTLLPIWRKLELENADFSGLKLLRSFHDAAKIFENWNETSELLAVWSPDLTRIKGSVNCEVQLTYLGLDCFSLGEWSVLLRGVYAQPEQFSWAVARLNEHGLLTSDADCNAVFDCYLELAQRKMVEPLMKMPQGTSVSVFSVVPEFVAKL